MNIANFLSVSLFLISLFISLRAFYLYFRSRSRRLFILGLSMAVIAFTAAAGFVGDNILTTINVDWFNYIGQTVSFLFILLSFVRSSDEYLRKLIPWHIICSVLLLILLALAPVLPDFPFSAVTRSLLSGSRGLMCFIIFYYYVFAFMSKATRFSLLMAGAFLLLSAGYFIIIPKYVTPNDVLDRGGDIFRVCGSITLFLAILLG